MYRLYCKDRPVPRIFIPAKNEIKTAAMKLRGVPCGYGATHCRFARQGSVVEPQEHAGLVRMGEEGRTATGSRG